MTTTLAILFSITAILYISTATALTQAAIKGHSTIPPTTGLKLTTKRTNPTTLCVRWNSGEHDFQNATVQFRSSGRSEWENSLGGFSETINLNLSNPCSEYDVRLRSAIGNYSQTVVSRPEIPKRLDQIKPAITDIRYNKHSNTIDVKFSIENHTMASWPLDSRDLKVEIHIFDHRPGLSTEDDSPYPVPSAYWATSADGYIRFAEPYISSVKSGGSFEIILAIEGSAKVCGQPVELDDRQIDDTVFLKLVCPSVIGMECLEDTKKKIPPPQCIPQSVTAIQTSIDGSETELRIQWDFKSDEAPKRILLHYGYTDLASDGDPLLILAPMHEIDRFEVDGASKNATLRTKKTPPEVGRDQSRIYRVSICAVYDNDSDKEISWGILTTFPVKTSQQSKEKQCRCEEPNKVTTETTTTTRAPSVVSSPSNPYENYWVKVAPLLVVFTVMTVLNLILFMASYYFYKKARSMNALK